LSGADFETLIPKNLLNFPLQMQMQMMRWLHNLLTGRIGPALCGGLSLVL